MAEHIKLEPRYIDINKFSIPKGFFNQDLNVPKIFDLLYSQPSADVVEVVHASWVWGKVCGSKGYCCTNCGAGFVGENAEWIAKEHDYCPKCGAKMDGERRCDE